MKPIETFHTCMDCRAAPVQVRDDATGAYLCLRCAVALVRRWRNPYDNLLTQHAG